MRRFVTLRALGVLSALLGLALAAAGAFGWLQTERLHAAKMTIAARDLVIQTLEQRIDDGQVAIAQRDDLIDKQNTAVLAIAQASAENRKVYQANLAAADRRAAASEAEAADILSRHIETTDELERSREALRLIEEVLGKETP